MDSGIYMIYCTDTNKPYIGQAEDLENRKQEHFSHLKIGNHPCVDMQKDYNKYGEDSFRFSILEKCEKDKLNHLEDYYILSYNAISNGYNSKRGNIISMSERNFYSNALEAESWEILLNELHNDRCDNNLKRIHKICLQTYIYEMNQIYKQNKTISDYLPYIIGDNSRFYVYEKTLSGSGYTRVSKDNIEMIYDKYVILGENLIMTNRYCKEKNNILLSVARDIANIMDSIIYDDKKISDVLCEETENKIAILDIPAEREKFCQDINYDSYLLKLLTRFCNNNNNMFSAMRFGLQTIENKSHITLNDILNTNLKFEIDRR